MFLTVWHQTRGHEIVERICEQDDVDADWMKEYVLKAYQTKKNDKVPMSDTNEVVKLLKQALKKIPK